MASDWRRVSGIAIVYFVFDTARQAIGLWPALLPLLAGGEQFRANFISYGLPVLVLLFIASVLLHFWFFRYRVESDRIQLQSGVFSRKRLTLYFDRVQQADIAQPFYFRPFGLATLGLESAGSTQQEVDIPGLRFADAQALKDRILAQQSSAHETAAAGSEAAPSVDFELQLGWREVARYGLMYNGLLFLAPVLAPFMQYLGPSMEQWMQSLEGTAAHELLSNLSNTGLLWLLALAMLVALLSGLVVLFFVSVLIALLRFWDYRLTRVGDQFQYRAGFGTLKTRGFRLHKLQQVTIAQGLLARCVRRYSLTISKAGGAAPTPDEQHNKRFLVPVLNEQNLAAMREQLNLPEPRWQSVSPLYIVWRGLITATLAVLVLLLLPGEDWRLVSIPVAIAASFLAAWRIWYCLGIYEDHNWLALRTGFVGSRTQWLPKVKLQKLLVSEPPWLKPWGLATLSVWGADARLELPFIKATQAAQLRDQSLYRVVTFRAKWF